MITGAELDRIRDETPGVGKSTHLLACGSSLMPQTVVDAIIDHTKLEAELGGYEAKEARQTDLNAVYDKVAAHIGAQRHQIALVENATVAWCAAFYALPLQAGQRILTCESEYASNYIAFLQRAKRDGIEIEVIKSDPGGAVDVSALEAAIGPDVGLIAMTWVPTSGGLVNPAAEIGRVARAHGVPFLLDACQAVGQIAIDVTELGCDFLSATGRKFLRGPRGTGFLYAADPLASTLEPAMLDLHSATWVRRDGYELRPDARRFENWENAYALQAGLGAALDYADAIGMNRIEARVAHLADFCRARIAETPGLTVRDLGTRRCGIVSLEASGHDATALVTEMSNRGFAIGTSSAASTRIDFERRDLPTLIRIAPHYYNTEDEITACVDTLGALVKSAA